MLDIPPGRPSPGEGEGAASLLVEIANRYTLAGAARDAYARAAGSIRSGYERKRAEEALKDGRKG